MSKEELFRIISSDVEAKLFTPDDGIETAWFQSSYCWVTEDALEVHVSYPHIDITIPLNDLYIEKIIEDTEDIYYKEYYIKSKTYNMLFVFYISAD